MNFLVLINFSFNFFINITFELNCGKSFVRIFWLSFLWIFEVFIFFESLSGHPIFKRSLFWEHRNVTVIFRPSWLFDFFFFRLLWFCFSYLFNFRFRLLFFSYSWSLVFREIFLFRIFRLIFNFFYFRFFLNQRLKLFLFDISR